MKLDRHQLYVLAAHATFAQGTEINLKENREGKLIMAMKPKKENHPGIQSNGWVYQEVDKAGNTKLINLKEAKKK